MMWWVAFFEQGPESVFNGDQKRQHILVWTDAEGSSRWIAAVVSVQGQWYWTRLTVPDAVWSQFLPRDDAQIGMQELLAIPLAYATFAHFFVEH